MARNGPQDPSKDKSASNVRSLLTVFNFPFMWLPCVLKSLLVAFFCYLSSMLTTSLPYDPSSHTPSLDEIWPDPL